MAINPNITKRVQGYIDKDCYKAFLKFCSHWECSQSKGLELLIRKALIENDLLNTQNKSLGAKPDIEAIEELIEEKIRHEISAKIQPALDQLNEYSRTHLEYISQLSEKVEVLESNIVTTPKPPEKSPESLASDFSKLVTGDEGLTYQELAEKEGLKRSTVKSWRDRGLPTKGDNAKYSELYEIRDGKFYLK